MKHRILWEHRFMWVNIGVSRNSWNLRLAHTEYSRTTEVAVRIVFPNRQGFSWWYNTCLPVYLSSFCCFAFNINVKIWVFKIQSPTFHMLLLVDADVCWLTSLGLKWMCYALCGNPSLMWMAAWCGFTEEKRMQFMKGLYTSTHKELFT